MPFGLYQYYNFDISTRIIFMLMVLHQEFLSLRVLVVWIFYFFVLIKPFNIADGIVVG